jgi:hypothetical protein
LIGSEVEAGRPTRLLIKVHGRVGKFDGEQSLYAGVQVEVFTGPPGPDGLSVWMLETVHRR